MPYGLLAGSCCGWPFDRRRFVRMALRGDDLVVEAGYNNTIRERGRTPHYLYYGPLHYLYYVPVSRSKVCFKAFCLLSVSITFPTYVYIYVEGYTAN